MSTTAELQARIEELEQDLNRLQQENETLAVDSWLFRTLLASVPDNIYFKDCESRFIRASDAMAKFFHLDSSEDMVGKSDFDFFTKEHAQPAYEDEQRIIATGQPITLEEKETHPDGSVTWALTAKMPLKRNREIVGTFGISKNITERKQAEENIKELNATLEARVEERTAELEHEISERQKTEEERAKLHQQIIDAQRQALQELSTPIIPLVEGIIVMPLIGGIDTMRASAIMRSLLAGITQHRASVVILDITGVPIVDTNIAAHLNKTIQAARLKGANMLITGISDAVAEAIVDLGIDWSAVETLRDLQAGFVRALHHQGFQLSKT